MQTDVRLKRRTCQIWKFSRSPERRRHSEKQQQPVLNRDGDRLPPLRIRPPFRIIVSFSFHTVFLAINANHRATSKSFSEQLRILYSLPLPYPISGNSAKSFSPGLPLQSIFLSRCRTEPVVHLSCRIIVFLLTLPLPFPAVSNIGYPHREPFSLFIEITIGTPFIKKSVKTSQKREKACPETRKSIFLILYCQTR